MKFDNFFKELIQTEMKQNNIPMLLGGPGIGKSSWIEWFAETQNTKCFTLSCNQLGDKVDLTGARLVPCEFDVNNNPVDFEQKFYPHDVINQAIKYAEENPREQPILFLDEINRTTSDVTSALLSLATQRKVGSKSLPNNLRMIIAGNDKGNVVATDAASNSRFVFYRMEPCVETFLAINPELNVFVKNALTRNPQFIYEERPLSAKSDEADENEDADIDDILDDSDEMIQITTPRTITGLSRFLNNCSKDFIMSAINTVKDGKTALEEIVYGHIGYTNLAVLIVQEIIQNIMTVSSTNNIVQIKKPDCFDDLKNTTTVKELEDKINALSEREKSFLLVYALHDNNDNFNILTALSNQITEFTDDAKKVLFGLVQNNDIDEANLNAFVDTKTPIAVNIGFVTSSLV